MPKSTDSITRLALFNELPRDKGYLATLGGKEKGTEGDVTIT